MINRKISKISVLTVIISIIVTNTTAISGEVIKSDVQKDVKDQGPTDIVSWTYMVYWVGDMTVNTPDDKNAPGDVKMVLPAMNLMELSGSTPEVNIVIQVDDYNIWGGDKGAFGGTRRYHIQNDDNPEELADYTLNENVWYLEEQNMGNPNTLKDFINWATSNYPAEHYILVLAGHGGGWVGICSDYSSGIFNPDSIINIPEMGSVLSSCPHLDILLLYGCQMGQIEVYYELKEFADIILAVESIMAGSPLMIEIPLEELTSNPQLTSEEIAQLFVDNYLPELYYDIQGLSPLFGIQSKDIDNITNAVDNLAEAIIEQYRSNPLRTRLMLYSAFKNSTIVLQFKNSRDTDEYSHELYKFAEKLSVLSKNMMQTVYNAALKVISVIDNSSIIKPSNKSNENYHGAAIFSPPPIYSIGFIKYLNLIVAKFVTRKTKYNTLDFAKDANWDEFLNLYYLCFNL